MSLFSGLILIDPFYNGGKLYFKKIQMVGLIPMNNTINIFLVNPNRILIIEYPTYMFFSYDDAEKYMLKALMQVQKVQQSTISSKWESLLNNLGHTSRKLGKLEDALSYHQQALVLKPKSSSTYAAIGYTQTLMQKYFEAVESFHKALSLKRDDAFSTTMLNNVVEHLVDDITPYESKKFDF